MASVRGLLALKNDEFGVRIRFFVGVVAAQDHVGETCALEHRDKLVREVEGHPQDVLLRHVLAVPPPVGAHLERHTLGQRIELDDPAAQLVFRAVRTSPPVPLAQLSPGLR